MSLAASIISIVGALVYLVLLGLALTVAGWIGGRLFRLRELTFGRMLPVGLLQGLVAGFSLLIVAQLFQFSPFAGTIITLVVVLLIGLGELRLILNSTWKAAFKPWGVMSIFQLVLGIPAALLLSLLVPAAMNLLVPPVI